MAGRRGAKRKSQLPAAGEKEKTAKRWKNGRRARRSRDAVPEERTRAEHGNTEHGEQDEGRGPKHKRSTQDQNRKSGEHTFTVPGGKASAGGGEIARKENM